MDFPLETTLPILGTHDGWIHLPSATVELAFAPAERDVYSCVVQITIHASDFLNISH